MFLKFAIVSTALCAISPAAVRSGKASADWITTSATFESGKPVQTAIRLVLDEGWHTYWLNPGEGGMKFSVTWELPAGWRAGELEHPVPKRFMTGDLPGFGYEGTVIFPVKFTPPTGFEGKAKLKGKVSWLTCNDDSCIPGQAELELSLNHGPPAPTPEAELIAGALQNVPARQTDGPILRVIEKPKTLALTIAGLQHDPAGSEIFPATPQAINPAAKFAFIREGDQWTAEVSKNEYATEPIRELTLVLAGKSTHPPLALTWSMKSH